MISPASLSEKLIFSTVRLEVTSGAGTTTVGTAFFFVFKYGAEIGVPVLLTNKHVMLDVAHVRFQAHESKLINGVSTPGDKNITVDIDIVERELTHHPDPSVDLCALDARPILRMAREQGRTVLWSGFGNEYIPEQSVLEDLRAVEEVLMAGYPTGLWDEVNNFPIVRRGITATHPAVDFRGKSEFVIDMACFPGSSGSPVVIMNEGAYTHKRSDGLVLASRLMLLGVLYAGPRYLANGSIVVEEIPSALNPIAEVQMMMHLGYVIKAREILVAGDTLRADLRGRGEKIP